ncbi:unnamed protein product, partial [Owenia fusiformis]
EYHGDDIQDEEVYQAQGSDGHLPELEDELELFHDFEVGTKEPIIGKNDDVTTEEEGNTDDSDYPTTVLDLNPTSPLPTGKYTGNKTENFSSRNTPSDSGLSSSVPDSANSSNISDASCNYETLNNTNNFDASSNYETLNNPNNFDASSNYETLINPNKNNPYDFRTPIRYETLPSPDDLSVPTGNPILNSHDYVISTLRSQTFNQSVQSLLPNNFQNVLGNSSTNQSDADIEGSSSNGDSTHEDGYSPSQNTDGESQAEGASNNEGQHEFSLVIGYRPIQESFSEGTGNPLVSERGQEITTEEDSENPSLWTFYHFNIAPYAYQ